MGQKILVWKKFWIQKKICLKKTGRVNPRWRIYDPPPLENSRVKILLYCCLFGLVKSPTKFQTPRIIISGRSRVPGWWGGCKVIIVSNPTRLRLGYGWVVVRLGFWQLTCGTNLISTSVFPFWKSLGSFQAWTLNFI